MESKKWLDEANLKEFLERIFKKEFIHNRQIPNSGLKYRPDYRNEELKILVEYDGPRHYTSAKTALLDSKKDKLYKDLGYDVVRIPYFIQVETRTIPILFKRETKIAQTYPHGFNEKNVVLPADFCELGIERFSKELMKFIVVLDDIKDSLDKKVKESELFEVYPYSTLQEMDYDLWRYNFTRSGEFFIYKLLEASTGENWDDPYSYINILYEFIEKLIKTVGRKSIDSLHPAIQTFIYQLEKGEETVFSGDWDDDYDKVEKDLREFDRWGLY